MFRLAVIGLLCVAPVARGDERVQKFVSAQCYDCHVGEDAEAGLDLQALSRDLDDDVAFEKWVRVVDRVRDGEMPPADASELAPKQRKSFVDSAGSWLRRQQRGQYARMGRVRGRRLTNLQLERTLHDLLGIDIPLASRLPEEPRPDGFTTVADGQPMSHFQLERHLGLIDVALDEAFRRAKGRDDLIERRLSARQIARRNPRRRTREPEMRQGQAVVWSGRTTFYGRIPATTAREDGWFRFRIKASALKPPQSGGVWCSVRSGRNNSGAPLLTWVSSFEATEEPNEWTFEAWLPQGHMLEIRPGDTTLKQARFRGGQIGTGEGEPQNVPGLAMDWLTIQRIHKGADDKQIRKLLFGDLSDKSMGPRKRLRQLVHKFAERAFRRPLDTEVTEPFVKMALSVLDDDGKPVDAVRAGYRAVLCSPRFLYFAEPVGKLDDYAIASRLSYFLWNTMPDELLMAAAKAGTLSDRTVVREQVERMLQHERGRHFVRDFAHEWLDLSEIDFTQPDRRRHPDFDLVVQHSMLDETHAFLHAMLDEDLSVTNLIASDFTFLNSRLARFYGIPGVSGDELRRVEPEAKYNRGGLLTHGSVLKVTANGTTTSPVVRGVWVAERLLGEHIPPPPEGIPAIEPDIRGAKTIREQLAKHRSDASCASCHVKIDPAGFALENYDPAGKWRGSYYHRNRRLRQKIDPSYQLADGSRFKNIRDFRRLIVGRPDRLAKNVAEKLLTYGTGAKVGFVDRAAVDEIVQATADNNYGFRSILHSVIESSIFQTK